MKTNYTGNGTTTTYEVGFEFLDVSHVRVAVNGVVKVLGTDYSLGDVKAKQGAKAIIKFGTAPTNGHAIVFTRVTPRDYDPGALVISNIESRQALYMAQEAADAGRALIWEIGATELSAGTAVDYVAPFDGVIVDAYGIVDTAIVTGGDVTVNVGTTAVDGLTLTFANSATKGTVVSDTPTSGHATTRFKKGDRLSLVPSAAFNGGGALRGFLTIKPEASLA